MEFVDKNDNAAQNINEDTSSKAVCNAFGYFEQFQASDADGEEETHQGTSTLY
jgi:hypothetical protein